MLEKVTVVRTFAIVNENQHPALRVLTPNKSAERITHAHLRHTCATLLLSSNVHPKYVQELLGHASIALTLDTYSHVLEGMNGGIGDAMDAAVG